MKIEKDAEWLRLEGKVGQAMGDLSDARRKLAIHVSAETLRQLGLSVGSIVGCRGSNYSVTRAGDYSWLFGRKIRKNGTPSDVETNLYSEWTKEQG
jgi:hypothetical protein